MQSNPTIPVAVDSDTLLRVIATAADALYVVDRDGFVRFLNPAAAAILGYAKPEELAGRRSHETIHYLRADGSPFPVEECPMLRVRVTGQTLHTEEDWFVRKDGAPVATLPFPATVGGASCSRHYRASGSVGPARGRREPTPGAGHPGPHAADAARKQIRRDIRPGPAISLSACAEGPGGPSGSAIGGVDRRNRAEPNRVAIRNFANWRGWLS
jgi:PAS domain S-box-containing protein